jgi:hypothetical protein
MHYRFMGHHGVPVTQPMRERSTWSNLMPTPIACHRCAVLATRKRDGDAIKISYDYSVWARCCMHSSLGSLTSCPEMRPLLLLEPDDKIVEVCGKTGK